MVLYRNAHAAEFEFELDDLEMSGSSLSPGRPSTEAAEPGGGGGGGGVLRGLAYPVLQAGGGAEQGVRSVQLSCPWGGQGPASWWLDFGALREH